jgi:hypothetical protein
MFSWKSSLNEYKGIHRALEEKTFIANQHLQWVLVLTLAHRSLDFPLITTISIVRKERGITYTQEINKQNLSDYTHQD